MRKEVIICLDIGGTNCRLGLVDREGTLRECRILSTEAMARQGFVPALREQLAEYAAAHGECYALRAVSMGFPATVDRTRRKVLSAPNIPGLPDDLPICQILEEALGLPVFLERDVNLLLYYDLRDLALPKNDTVIGVYFGTGIGNSIYLGGRFHNGANGVAGELGHIPRLGQETLCGCGNACCIEPLGGGRRLSELCETEFSGTEIKNIYLHHGSSESVRQQVEVMAAAVATEVNILDPDHVVLGGGLLQMEGFPREFFEERIRFHTRKPYPLNSLRLLYARPDQTSGIIGAGLHGWSKLGSDLDSHDPRQ